MRLRLKLLVVCLLLCAGFDYPQAIAAAQVEAMVEGTGEHILVGQASATPSPSVNALPVDEDIDDPEEGVITASRSPRIEDINPAFDFGMSTIVPDPTALQLGKPPEEHAPTQA